MPGASRIPVRLSSLAFLLLLRCHLRVVSAWEIHAAARKLLPVSTAVTSSADITTPVRRKDVYREVFDAVLRAEASCHQAPADKASVNEPVQAQAEFKLYTPSTCTQERLDADVDMDVGYSSDWDSDEDEDEDDDMFLDEDSDSDAPTYDALVALDGAAANTPKLPRLSSIRVYALEAVPEQTGRNGVPFMGRGTPVDKQRRADWAAPARPFFPFVSQPWSVHSTPQPEYYSPSPEMPFQQPGMQMAAGMEMTMDVGYDGAMQVDVQVQMPVPTATPFGMNVIPQMEQAFAQQQQQQECLSWLDPALRAESMSPSPSPAPTSILSLSGSAYPSQPQQDIHDFPAHTPSPDLSSSSSCSSTSSSSLGSPSPTGCAWHATFLQCLQSPAGCAPFFAPAAPAPAPAPVMEAYAPPPPVVDPVPVPVASGVDMGVGVGISVGMGMFPNQELAQFVRSHLVPGSVTLSHALG
ncbi:hypothetical protein L226DRAFT_266937 [Lentinus tigrinus ALCF2SS1-7]|uniref:Uncharacterized protein n=1 Tax=Lentinus tigrinus ALCF2SS1-6 TaxID=1328759 RepID=A0A5C2RW99_9APHY|nr:hypothetical protein L227DRAFT_332075 [Lentinus tigrinus ALCF2SS1-6]RPD69698.1 hypothetical protein L226DRAFT_266937 [Lentinus tigrinus ALCF2SS1-7]